MSIKPRVRDRLTTISQIQRRRLVLHAMPILNLKRLYARRTGRIMSEVNRMYPRGHSREDAHRQVMIDIIIEAETA